MTAEHLVLYILFILQSASVSAFTVLILLPRLKRCARQPIYEEGPAWHLSKSGTPTMGGISFLVSAITSLVLIFIFADGNHTSITASLIISLIYAILNSAVGIFDDVKKLLKKQNAGLSPLEKLTLQLLLAVLFIMARKHFLGDGTAIYTPFGSLELGILYYPLAIIILLGIINCANLTDGVDGLASCVSFAIGISLIFISPAFSASGIIGAMLCGISLGFLIFNINPAKIFMGDTGSLFLGALAVSSAFALKSPASAITLGGVYVIEGVSVILQVIYYKLTKKRLFKMAPLHHHLEKCGFEENKICLIAIIATLILSLFTPLLIK